MVSYYVHTEPPTKTTKLTRQGVRGFWIPRRVGQCCDKCKPPAPRMTCGWRGDTQEVVGILSGDDSE